MKECNNKDLNKIRQEYKADGFALIQYDNNAIHSYPYDSPWLNNKKFNKIYESIQKNTLVDRPRCYSLYLLIDQIKNIPGDILEVGTWRGGTAGLFTQVIQNKVVYLADTFEGVVKSSRWEHYKDKAHADTSKKLVIDFLEKDLGVSNFKILKGVFPDDTGYQVENNKFSFVYFDLDVYISTKEAFNFIWDKVTIGGIVAFDDYGMISACEGISKFVDEIKNDEDKIFITNLNGQAYIIKK